MKYLIALALTIFLTACGDADLNRHFAKCQYEIKLATYSPSNSHYPQTIPSAQYNPIINACMRAEGYRLTKDGNDGYYEGYIFSNDFEKPSQTYEAIASFIDYMNERERQ